MLAEEFRARFDTDGKFELMANASPVMIWVTDAEGRIRFVNRAYEMFFGTTAEAIVREGWQPRLHPDDVDAYAARFFDALRNRTPFDATCRALRADGVWRWVHSYGAPYYSPSGAVLGIVGSSPDITAQMDTEAALRESESRFRNMADHAPVVIWMSEADGRCSFVGASWFEHTGQPPEAALGSGWLQVVHPLDVERVKAAFRNAAPRAGPYRCEYRLRAPDGTYRWVLSAASPRLGSRGEFVGYIGSILDITERKQREDSLAEDDRRKNIFLAVLAHELRNPLAPIAAASELIQRQADGPVQAASEIIARQVRNLTRLVDELLDIARLTTGKIELQLRRVTLQEIVAGALDATRGYIEERGQDVVVSHPVEPLYVDADPVRLGQVAVNLLTNAAKYTPRGGHIEIVTARRDGALELRVADDGIGISREMLPRIFDMFTQVSSPYSRGEGGLGIGLALARSIVEMHSGAITAKSGGLGAGSTFVVRLPAAAAPAVPPATAPAGTAANELRRRVLVVDDNADSAQSLAMLLELLGHEVSVAHDGPAALRCAEYERPELVLLDIGMPGMNGLDVAREMRRRPWGRTLRLVALTGFGQDSDKQESFRAGFDGHLTKPVDVADIEALLSGAASPEAAQDPAQR